jgi:ABC-type multidrug transport system ATPase subunit
MIELQGVARDYGLRRRRVRALDGVTLHVPAGASVGIVGPNGAGKSTLLRLLLGYIRPSAGTVLVDGVEPRAYAERHGIGYVPERPAIPPRWTTRRALHAFAAMGDVEPWQERVSAAMRDLGLDAVAERRVGALSKGNLQRLTLAQALMGDRKLLILDEPTDGVDPEWRARIRDVLRGWRAADPARVLLFASHDLDEVERIADRVVVLSDGRVRDVLDMRAASDTLPPYRLVLDPASGDAAGTVASLFPGARRLEPAADGWLVTAPDLVELNRRLAALLAAGGVVRSLAPESRSLEQRFRHSLGRAGPDEPDAPGAPADPAGRAPRDRRAGG